MLIAAGTNQGGLRERAPKPGAPLCRTHSDDPAHAECEIALKDGQIGAPDFFCAVMNGGV